jgi:hypothetical protein
MGALEAEINGVIRSLLASGTIRVVAQRHPNAPHPIDSA